MDVPVPIPEVCQQDWQGNYRLEFRPDLGPERDLRGTLVQLLYLPVGEMGAPERVVVCQRPGRTLAGPREGRCPRGKGNQTA